MANQDVRVSALNSTSTLSTDDLSLETVVDELSETGYTSKKITEGAKASQYLEAFTYANLNTTAKTIIGAINEAAESGGAGAFIIHWGASITESGPDIWAAYEGGEVLIIELGSASPFDYLELTKVYVTSSYINLSFNGIDDGGAYVRAQIILNPSTKAIIDSSFLRGGVLGQIDDTTTASGKVWSSSKIAEELADKAEIADTVVSTASAWSSSRIVGLLPIDTASGAVANFPDGADNVPVKSLVANIEPVQAGTGDPSPSNVRPISGWSAVNVTRTGANIWDEQMETGSIDSSNGQNVNYGTDRMRSKNYVAVKPNSTYYFCSVNNVGGQVFKYDKNKAYLGVLTSNVNTSIPIPSDCYYIRFRTADNYGISYNNDFSVNYPSTDTTYHAYTGASVEISLGQTVYGGELDVTNGVLRVTHVYYDLAYKNTPWNSGAPNEAGFVRFNFIFTDKKNGYSVICDKFKTIIGIPSDPTEEGISGYSSNSAIYVAVSASRLTGDLTTTAGRRAAFNNWIDTNGLNIVYELATPIEITLTPTELSTLYGVNNFWADTGNTSIEYRADIQKYIEKKIAEAVSNRSLSLTKSEALEEKSEEKEEVEK